LDGAVFQGPYATADDIRNCVRRTITQRIKKSNFILAPVTDGLRTEIWRLFAVRDALNEIRN